MWLQVLGGTYMIEALYGVGFLGFLQFLKTAIFAVRIYFWK